MPTSQLQNIYLSTKTDIIHCVKQTFFTYRVRLMHRQISKSSSGWVSTTLSLGVSFYNAGRDLSISTGRRARERVRHLWFVSASAQRVVVLYHSHCCYRHPGASLCLYRCLSRSPHSFEDVSLSTLFVCCVMCRYILATSVANLVFMRPGMLAITFSLHPSHLLLNPRPFLVLALI